MFYYLYIVCSERIVDVMIMFFFHRLCSCRPPNLSANVKQEMHSGGCKNAYCSNDFRVKRRFWNSFLRTTCIPRSIIQLRFFNKRKKMTGFCNSLFNVPSYFTALASRRVSILDSAACATSGFAQSLYSQFIAWNSSSFPSVRFVLFTNESVEVGVWLVFSVRRYMQSWFGQNPVWTWPTVAHALYSLLLFFAFTRGPLPHTN